MRMQTRGETNGEGWQNSVTGVFFGDLQTMRTWRDEEEIRVFWGKILTGVCCFAFVAPVFALDIVIFERRWSRLLQTEPAASLRAVLQDEKCLSELFVAVRNKSIVVYGCTQQDILPLVTSARLMLRFEL